MIALKITDIKDFMSKLLIGNVFDSFYLIEASITTFNTYTIDGTLQKNFYEEEQAKKILVSGQTYSLWKDNKNFCFSLIKGTRTPLHFKIVFQQSRENTDSILKSSGCTINAQDVNGLYLNFQYSNGELICTTGVSLRIFTMDRSLEHTWDSLVMKYFSKQNFSFQQM